MKEAGTQLVLSKYLFSFYLVHTKQNKNTKTNKQNNNKKLPWNFHNKKQKKKIKANKNNQNKSFTGCQMEHRRQPGSENSSAWASLPCLKYHGQNSPTSAWRPPQSLVVCVHIFLFLRLHFNYNIALLLFLPSNPYTFQTPSNL